MWDLLLQNEGDPTSLCGAARGDGEREDGTAGDGFATDFSKYCMTPVVENNTIASRVMKSSSPLLSRQAEL